MNTSEVLNRAADLIEERGWAQGAGWPIDDPRAQTNGALCLEGGIMAAAGIIITPDPLGGFTDERFEPLTTCPAYMAVRAYLGDALSRETTPLWSWNDRSSRTAEQVIATLRAAALIEAAKENADAQIAVTA